MRAVVQRVKEAKVEVQGEVVGEIGKGILVFVGVGDGDTEKDSEFLAGKVAHLRIFPDETDPPRATHVAPLCLHTLAQYLSLLSRLKLHHAPVRVPGQA